MVNGFLLLSSWRLGHRRRFFFSVDRRPFLGQIFSMCDRCAMPAFKCMTGVYWKHGSSWRLQGNSLCKTCYCQLREDVGEYAPRPGYSKPARFLVASAEQKNKKPCDAEAITLAICYGNWLKALEISKEDDRTRRYTLSELRLPKVSSKRPNGCLIQNSSEIKKPVSMVKQACPVCRKLYMPNKDGSVRRHYCTLEHNLNE